MLTSDSIGSRYKNNVPCIGTTSSNHVILGTAIEEKSVTEISGACDFIMSLRGYLL